MIKNEANSLYEQSKKGKNVIGKFFVENGKDTRGTGVVIVRGS